MKAKVLLAVGIVLLLVILLPTTILALDDPLSRWYFWDTPYGGNKVNDGTTHVVDNIMAHTRPCEFDICCEYDWIGYVDSIVDYTRTAWWYSNASAPVLTAYPAGDWHADIKYRGISGIGNLSAEIYSVAPNGSITGLIASGKVEILTNNVEQVVSITCPGVAFNVPAGDRLAIKLSYLNSENENCSLNIYYGGFEQCSSSLMPVPELATIVLFGGGAFSLLGYMAIKRLRKRPIEV